MQRIFCCCPPTHCLGSLAGVMMILMMVSHESRDLYKLFQLRTSEGFPAVSTVDPGKKVQKFLVTSQC